jgi:glycosyltransferase involved in cell wall biosynthesis
MIKNKKKHSLAYVIPTKDRPNDLRVLFSSLTQQTVYPDQIIVVDGSKPSIRYVCNEFKNLPITYERCYPPSLAKQRNAGMKCLMPDITIAGYLDDDLELDREATKKMYDFWKTAPINAGGAAFSIRNQPQEYHSLFRRLFGITGRNFGTMLPSGFSVYIPDVNENLKTEWLYGGATVWNREVIDSFDYDEWYSGHGYLEDVDFSFRVGLNYELFVLGESKCLHHSDPLNDNQQYIFGKQQIYNRFYFVRKMKTFSIAHFYWAIFGNILMNLVAFLKKMDKPHWNRIKGNFAGLIHALGPDNSSILGFWK